MKKEPYMGACRDRGKTNYHINKLKENYELMSLPIKQIGDTKQLLRDIYLNAKKDLIYRERQISTLKDYIIHEQSEIIVLQEIIEEMEDEHEAWVMDKLHKKSDEYKNNAS